MQDEENRNMTGCYILENCNVTSVTEEKVYIKSRVKKDKGVCWSSQIQFEENSQTS